MALITQRKPNVRESGFGGAASIAVAANFSYVALNNNSAGPAVLVVHSYDGSLFSAQSIGVTLVNGLTGTAASSEVPAVAGEGAPAGLIYTGAIATLPSRLTRTTVPGNNFFLWPHDYPVAYILPGWSFAVFCVTVNITLNASFWWEQLPAELYYQWIENQF